MDFAEIVGVEVANRELKWIIGYLLNLFGVVECVCSVWSLSLDFCSHVPFHRGI